MEVLKPLVVLALFGMILYGAYSVVQKGPTPDPAATADQLDAPPFVAPDVEVAAARPAEAPTALGPAPTATVPVPAAQAVESAAVDHDPTYLPAQSAPPPSADQVAPRQPVDPATMIPPAVMPAATIPEAMIAPAQSGVVAETPTALAASLGDSSSLPAATGAAPSSAAFASAWSDAHDKLTSGRYAEALTALSVWYDDPALGLEESQRLEDLLGQLAGTVIYSQQDLLMPPHVVAPGETLASVAGPLGVSPQLLAKINGIDDPQRLLPGEHLKVVRGPFDAVVSVSRRRISLQLNGAYAGSFPVVVGRRYLEKIGASLPVVELQRGMADAAIPVGTASLRRSIMLGDGLVIEAVDDPAAVADAAPQTSLVMTVRDLDEMLDILGTASRVLVRQ